MAYTKHNWVTGEVITAEKLDNVESGVDNAQWKTETLVPLFSESVTTSKVDSGDFFSGELEYPDAMDADILAITFNGVKYVCEKQNLDRSMPAFSAYGASLNSDGTVDFSEYPFAIIRAFSNQLITQNEGTYSVSVSTISAITSKQFNTAVTNASTFVVTFTENDGTWSSDKTLAECSEAYNAGKTVIGKAMGQQLLLRKANNYEAYFYALIVGSLSVGAHGISWYINDRTYEEIITYNVYDLQSASIDAN